MREGVRLCIYVASVYTMYHVFVHLVYPYIYIYIYEIATPVFGCRAVSHNIMFHTPHNTAALSACGVDRDDICVFGGGAPTCPLRDASLE